MVISLIRQCNIAGSKNNYQILSALECFESVGLQHKHVYEIKSFFPTPIKV